LSILREPDAQFAQGLTHIIGISEIREGQVVVVDDHEPRVLLLDRDLANPRPLGAIGQGPGEYSWPIALTRVAGDSVAVVEALNFRSMVITPDGQVVGSERMAPRTCETESVGRRVLELPVADRRGRYYGQFTPIELSANGEVRPSASLTIERWMDVCARDTVAVIPQERLSPETQVVSGLLIGLRPLGPLSATIQWAVSPNGAVAIVDHNPYRVRVVAEDGTERMGPVMEYDPIPVTEGHKERWRAERLGDVVTQTCSRGGECTIRVEPFNPRYYVEPEEWPSTLPPFVDRGYWDAAVVILTDDGGLVVKRAVPADAPPSYDVFDDSGLLRGRVELPLNSRIVAFGDKSVYVVRRDDFGLEFVERYNWPPE
jgi:hypothetical protein